MKKITIVLAIAICGLGTVIAQNENSNSFEGEVTAKVSSVTKMKSQTHTKNILAKVIIKKVMKKYIDENPTNFTGTYTATSVAKGNKMKQYSSYNNCVTISTKEGGKQKMTFYYPYIKKGYTTEMDIEAAKKQNESIKKGDPEKTGATINVLGHNCDIYKLVSENVTDTLDTKTVLNIHQEFAMCDDPGLPPADQEYVKGVKGVPLKYTMNTVTQMTNKMLNIDILLSVSSMTTSINPRPVDDSEFDIPSDIKLYDAAKDARIVFKINDENRKYMEKNGLWVENDPDTSKIYDNLNEEWDY